MNFGFIFAGSKMTPRQVFVPWWCTAVMEKWTKAVFYLLYCWGDSIKSNYISSGKKTFIGFSMLSNTVASHFWPKDIIMVKRFIRFLWQHNKEGCGYKTGLQWLNNFFRRLHEDHYHQLSMLYRCFGVSPACGHHPKTCCLAEVNDPCLESLLF